jgi:hypothetical protein
MDMDMNIDTVARDNASSELQSKLFEQMVATAVQGESICADEPDRQRDSVLQARHTDFTENTLQIMEDGLFIPYRPSDGTVGGCVDLDKVTVDDVADFNDWQYSIDHNYITTTAAAYDYLEHIFDFDKLRHTIQYAVQFLDNEIAVQCCHEGVDELREQRNINLSLMGWAKLSMKTGLDYQEEQCMSIANVLFSRFDEIATQESHKLAEERGTFGLWDESKYANPEENREWFINRTHQRPSDWEDGYTVRNQRVTVAESNKDCALLADTTPGVQGGDSAEYKHIKDEYVDTARELYEKSVDCEFIPNE